MTKLQISKYYKIFIILIVGLVFFSISAQSLSAQSKNEKAVTAVLMQNAAAVEKKDLEMLDKLWANDESVTVFEGGHANYGWLDYRNNHLAPELKGFENLKYAFSDIKIKMDGKTAWATLKYTLIADIGKRHVDSGGLATVILEKREGKWKIVHWHSSASY